MGGLLIAVIVLMTVIICYPYGGRYGTVIIIFLLFSLLNMLIGFTDDYIKVVKKRNLGLTARQKICGQVVISFAFTVFCYYHPAVGSTVLVPIVNIEWDMGVLYIPVMTMLLIFIVNSANLQDGVDGILASVTSVGASAWSIIALICFMRFTAAGLDGAASFLPISIIGMALTGACLGFLRYNYHPAKVIMGDTGSMFIGSVMAGMGLVLRYPLLLLLIAFTMIMSSVSVIIQRIYYKATHGKRIFKMSPLHHHYELSGMNEMQIVAMYTAVTGVLSLVALFIIL
jgi:phospho-N-acetylmuramoyl-pentapeptide-transferase